MKTGLILLATLMGSQAFAQSGSNKWGSSGSISFEQRQRSLLQVVEWVSRDGSGLMQVVLKDTRTGEMLTVFVRHEDLIQIAPQIWVLRSTATLQDI